MSSNVSYNENVFVESVRSIHSLDSEWAKLTV